MTLIDQATASLPLFLFAVHFGDKLAGLLSIAFQVLRLPALLIGQAVSQVAFERAARLRDDPAEMRILVRRIMAILFVVGMIPVILILPFGPFLFKLVFGESFLQAGEIARILVIGTCASITISPLGNLPGIYERLGGHLRLAVISVVLRLTGLVAGISLSSWFWCLTLMTVGEMIAAIIFARWSYRLIPIRNND